MNLITSTLLLVHADEEEAFWMSKLHAHLTQLGVDLAAICFSWFLSLFTDCLPVEVSSPFSSLDL